MSTKPQLTIRSQAPTRIDLAGGTVDIWPLYLFLKDPLTINLGIDLFAEAELQVLKSEAGITLASEDQNLRLQLGWKDLESFSPPPGLMLHHKLLVYFAKQKQLKKMPGLELKTRAKSPAGAGLGGSSALSIAMIGALGAWAHGKFDAKKEGDHFIEIVRDTETTVIQVPAGLQDYYGAMYGGLQCLGWRPGIHEKKPYKSSVLADLEKRLILFYSGHSRNSGINNWNLFKAFIDKTGNVRQQFQEISDATTQLNQALLKKDWKAVGLAISNEWSVRQHLAEGISTPEIDNAFRIAKNAGASAMKICGAGGGGCFFVYLSDPDSAQAERVKNEVLRGSSGIRHLPFKTVNHGIQVKISRAK